MGRIGSLDVVYLLVGDVNFVDIIFYLQGIIRRQQGGKILVMNYCVTRSSAPCCGVLWLQLNLPK